MNVKKLISEKKLTIFLLLAVLILNLIPILNANLDFSEGAFALDMDEMITFNGVHNTLHSTSLKKFLFNVLDGGDHRYGRILWNMSSVTGFFPELFWGEKGLIRSIRFTQTIFLIISYLILIFTFVKKPWIQTLGFFILMASPFTPYYVTAPKPEPIQLFFLALFLMTLNSSYEGKIRGWFHLGMSFGAKISTLPYAFYMLVSASFTKGWKSALNGLLFFLIGLVVAVPILGKGKFRTYLESTLFNTGHGVDSAAVTPLVWINYIFHDYLRAPSFIVYTLAILICFLLVILFLQILKQRSLAGEIIYSPQINLFVCSMSFILPIILKVKRVWGFYLHNGTVLLFIWVLLMCELLLEQKNSVLKKLAAVLTLVILLMIGIFGTESNYIQYRQLAGRTLQDSYKKKLREYHVIENLIQEKAKSASKLIKVSLDPNLFNHFSSGQVQVSLFWGPFNLWRDEYDLIILYKENHPSNTLQSLTPKSSIYKATVESFDSFKVHTGRCTGNPCYKEVVTPLEEILVLEKI